MLLQSNLSSSISPCTTYLLAHSNQVSSYLVDQYINRNEKEILNHHHHHHLTNCMKIHLDLRVRFQYGLLDSLLSFLLEIRFYYKTHPCLSIIFLYLQVISGFRVISFQSHHQHHFE
jgi:hypothetical protein